MSGAALLADLVLAAHVAVVAFVVLGLLLVVVGGLFGWRWTRNRRFRQAHLATVAFIALQSWLGRLCPLTDWEQALRLRAGQTVCEGSFIACWLDRLLYVQAPWWAFVAAYTLFALAVAAAWWRWPPAPARGRLPAH
ncbi:MAG: DUF2784 domain-containing protein [Xanthomonadales bacterium]|nr:DUF2784 domain-containing protein [Xanthomonadales bacterium]